jgi:hypothetical protein
MRTFTTLAFKSVAAAALLAAFGGAKAFADEPYGFDGRPGPRFGRDGERFGGQRRMTALTGLPLNEAISLLRMRGAQFTIEERLVPEAALDVVLDQRPMLATRFDRRPGFVLVVAQATRVPRLLGLTSIEADRVSRRAGLVLDVTAPHRYGDRFSAHGRRSGHDFARMSMVVDDQSRPAGTRIASGSTLRVRVRPVVLPLTVPPSVGPGHRPWTAPTAALLVEVPDLVGRDLQEARALLERAGLTAEVSGEPDSGRFPGRPAGVGEVESQDVPAGARVARGTTVHLTLARDFSPSPRPNRRLPR